MIKLKQNMAGHAYRQAGWTLLEMMVAMGLFAFVITIVVSTFILAVTSQRRIMALRNIEDNTRFALESITREIRTGKNFSSASGQISFINSKSESVIYRFNNKIIEKSSDGGLNYLSVTSPEVSVDYLNFYLIGEGIGDNQQSRITITISATSQVGNQSANIRIQTTISGRMLQI